jgi:hypothetical protein
LIEGSGFSQSSVGAAEIGPQTELAGSELGFPNRLPNSFQNHNDSVVKSVLNNLGQAGWRRAMEDLVRYRAMESLCRQSAVFRPLESWRLLAEAEMWHHKALEEITNRSIGCKAPPAGALAHTAVLCNARDGSRLLAG